jgi:uncharacterized protein YydD (DUF2326 family)
MTAKQFLLQSVRIREKLAYIKERVEKLEADLGYHPIQLDDSGASKGTTTDKTTEKLAEIVDLQAEWERKRVQLEAINEEIRRTVELIPNTEYVAVLTARYLTENKRTPCRLNTWVAVAFKLGMTSEEAVKQKHKRAIKELEKILNADTL